MKPIKFREFLNSIDYDYISTSDGLNGFIRGIEINSRNIDKDYLFFALETGGKSGAVYSEDAIKRGALAVVTERKLGLSPYIRVKNTLDALTDFAKYYRKLFSINTIGITGSIGKTTVKEMLYLILRSKYKTVKNRGNLNNHIGLPYSIFDIDEKTKFAIFEMGMNHIGEIKYLTDIAKPNIALITSIAPCHIGFFKGIDEILNAKLELYYGLPSGGVFFLNAYDKMLKNIKRRKDINHIVIGEGGDYEITHFSESKNSIGFTLNNTKFTIPIIGKFNAINASMAAVIGKQYGVELEDSAEILRYYKTIEGRMRILHIGDGITVIDDTYNANPIAFKNMIDYIKNNYNNGKFAVIGDMLELGQFAEFYHKELGKLLNNVHFNMILYKGDYYRDVKTSIGKTDIRELNQNGLENMIGKIKRGDVILFKGSRGMRIEKWLEKFLQEYDYGI